ncbi:MAG: SH3 domain-containing protein [Crocinitomicaceae bacterium]|nr:SH3 domain-containing protein [Crocinitomicaceae bacterium]
MSNLKTTKNLNWLYKLRFSLILVFICSLSINYANAQSRLGWTTQKVNFRSGPGTDYGVISSLSPGQQIFIISSETENDFYNIIDIKSNREGYIHKSFVKLGKIVEEQQGGLFESNGSTSNYSPEAEIFNNTDVELTLKINSTIHYFSPHQKKTITLSPGQSSYRASAPGVVPYIGNEYLQSNMKYTWQFYIVTTYR